MKNWTERSSHFCFRFLCWVELYLNDTYVLDQRSIWYCKVLYSHMVIFPTHPPQFQVPVRAGLPEEPEHCSAQPESLAIHNSVCCQRWDCHTAVQLLDNSNNEYLHSALSHKSQSELLALYITECTVNTYVHACTCLGGTGGAGVMLKNKTRDSWLLSWRQWRGCTSGGVYVPCIHTHARWELL